MSDRIQNIRPVTQSAEVIGKNDAELPLGGVDFAGTFVAIGNATQPFTRLLQAVADHAHLLPQPIVIQQGRTCFTDPRAQTFEFVGEADFKRLLVQCRLFISHAGGATVFEAIRLGKKPVVVPRRFAFAEHVDDHQVGFANELASQGKIHVLYDIETFPEIITSALADASQLPGPTNNIEAQSRIAAVLQDYASDSHDYICLVTPSGGHLAEIRALRPIYADRAHFFVINVPIVEPADMIGCTEYISLSQRDLKFFVNMWEAAKLFRKYRPKAILTTGGGFSVAFALVGKLFGVRTIYIETVGKVTVPTVTGRIMYFIADRFFYQWQHVAGHFPRGEYIGVVL